MPRLPREAQSQPRTVPSETSREVLGLFEIATAPSTFHSARCNLNAVPVPVPGARTEVMKKPAPLCVSHTGRKVIAKSMIYLVPVQ